MSDPYQPLKGQLIMPQDEINQQVYREEATELLAELETALLELEEHPEDTDLIGRVFRAMHTIKGSGAMFGFDVIAEFTHDVETVFDMVRSGEIAVTKPLLDLTFAARDHIALLLDDEQANSGEATRITQGLRNIAGTTQSLSSDSRQADQNAAPSPDEGPLGPGIYRICFKPPQNIFMSGLNPLGLLEELEELGELQVIAHTRDIPDLAEMDPELCYIWWDMILITDKDENAIRDVFIFVEDESELSIDLIERAEPALEDAEYKKLGEILLDRGDLTFEELQAILSKQRRLGTLLVEAGVVDEEAVRSALAEQKAVRTSRQKATPNRPVKTSPASSSVRVTAEKLDYLVDLVGELVIVQARIAQSVSDSQDQLLKSLSEELERLSDELRDETLSIRMLPIGTTFSKFRRLVRDLSDELGKKIIFETNGAETELDRTVIEKINDPLVHILRNSIDHGIEPPETRKNLGKPEAGTLHLSAEHAGSEVVVSISDDGKGLDAQMLRSKGLAKGLITESDELSEREIFSLIFEAGFSTAETVSNVSGRGVGMDVVRRDIESLRGRVDIASTLGQGTTISIKLPLTMAIIDGLQVRIGEEFYVIPLDIVEECVELISTGSTVEERRQVIDTRGQIVPYIRLRQWFGLTSAPPSIEQIVITSIEGKKTGLVVDEVIGEYQTVIKSLGKVYQSVKEFSGATIKGDGSLALILDVPELIHLAGNSKLQEHVD
jgi:two-component system chemotaxis sensor kinase CheA